MPLVPVTLTDKGYEAAFKKNRNGMRVAITSFAVAQYASDYTPNSAQTALLGTVLYSGAITDVRTTQRGDRVYSCFIPDNSTPGTIYEIGLYTDDGSLFAIGVLNPRYDKTTVFQLRIYCYLRAPNQNASVEFEAADLPEIPTLKNYADLPAANVAGPNAYIVLNGHCGNDRFPSYAPVMVAKWKNGDEWAVISGSIVYTGGLADYDEQAGEWFTLPSTFTVNEAFDFAMFSVVDGSGKYQYRHVKYNSDEARFEFLDGGLNVALEVEDATTVRIWTGPGCCGGASV